MIDAKELRLGNWVHYKTRLVDGHVRSNGQRVKREDMSKNKDRVPNGYVEGTKDWQDQFDMLLEDGKTCHDCAHVKRCTTLFGQNPDDEKCQFLPNRFYPKQ